MAQVNDFVCDICGTSCKDAEVNGVKVPLLVYTVVGVAPNAEQDNVDTTLLPLPAELRSIALQPIARREYCVKCYAAAHGLAIEAPVPPVPAPAPAGPGE